MKKSLFALAALALAGISFSACDVETVNNNEGELDACSNQCASDEKCMPAGSIVNVTQATCVKEDSLPEDCTNGIQLNTDNTYSCAEAQSCGDITCEVGTFCTEAYNAQNELEKGCATEAVPDCASKNMLAQWQDDMTVLCIAADVRTCTDDSGCEDGYICGTEGYCVEGSREESTDHTFVRIDDLTPANKACCGKDDCGTPAVCTKDDPGADIDAIALVKADKSVKYVTSVVEYKNAFLEGGTFYKEGNIMALDSSQIKSNPDSIVDYAGADGNPKDVTCKYTHDGKQETAADYPFVSLGGEGGYIVVQMDGVIEVGDKLDVIEVGDCKLSNAEDSNGVKAQKEDIKVQVSITGADGSWKPVLEKGQASNGLISTTITAEHLQ